MHFFLKLYKADHRSGIHRPGMPLILVALLFVMSCRSPAVAAPAGQEVQSMTLAEAVTLALRHSRTVESAYLNRLLEKFDLQTAQDKFSPDFSLFSSASQASRGGASSHRTEVGGEAVLKVPTGGEFSLSWSQPVHTSESDQWIDNFGNNVVLSFTQPLLKGGGVQVNRADQVLAEYKERNNVLRLKDTLIDTITQVVYAYRRLLLARRGLEINRLSFKRSKELLERNRILIEEGRKAKVEIIENEASVASQELRFMISQNDVETKKLDLLKLLDIDQHTSIEPTESIEVEPVELKLATLLQLVFTNRSEYRQALVTLNMAETNLLLAKNKQLWQMDLETRYNMTNSSGYTVGTLEEESSGAGDYSLTVKLKIPFGEESTERELLQAKVAWRQEKIALKELKENIEISVQNTYRDIGMKWKQIELSQKARDLSRKQLDVELEKFKNNKSTNLAVILSQDRLIEAENNENTVKIAYLNALTELDMYLGTTLEHWGIDLEHAGKAELP
ncbi:MAG: TolC family protein [Candidatus Electrothrix sp. GM3_4]|nr:TolC family protein [Candidatus Electrothrix sp. GM3_4]